MPNDILSNSFGELFEYINKDEFNSGDMVQTIAIETSKGNIYKFRNNITTNEGENGFLKLLLSKNDTHIFKILCIWNSGEIDLPSYAFRKSLCEFDIKNKDAYILLKAFNGYNVRKINETF